jgi:hypothetical protein
VKTGIKKYEDVSPVEFLLLRQKLGLKRYRKTASRNDEERKILLELGLKKIEEKEKDDFIPIGFRRRRVKIGTLCFQPPECTIEKGKPLR